MLVHEVHILFIDLLHEGLYLCTHENVCYYLIAIFMGITFSLHVLYTLREESSQTNVILQYKLLTTILSAVCSVIQQS